MSDGLKLLKTILINKSTEKLQAIDSDLFVAGVERESYLFVTEHYRSYGVLPNLGTLEDRMEIDFPKTEEPVDFYLDRCVEREVFVNVRTQFGVLQSAMKAQDGTAIKEACAVLHRVSNNSRGDDYVASLGELASAYRDEYIQGRLQCGLLGIPTGWPSVDTETLGWQQGDLVVFVARPGSGKTNCLLHSCRHAWRKGKSVLFASMEMSSKQIMHRFAAQCAGLSPAHVRAKTLCDWTYKRFLRSLGEMEGDTGLHLYAGEFKGKTTEDLDLCVQEYSPDAIYVDGLYLMSSKAAPRNVGRYEKVAYVVDGLKRMALERNRPVIGTTQFNRTATSRSGSGNLNNLGYTDTLATHASIIISVKNPVDETAVHPTKRVLEFLKGREGEKDSVLINHTFAPLSFDEIYETTKQKKDRLEEEEAAEQANDLRGGGNQRPQGTGATTAHMNN